jgi:hypothetical protein
MEIAVLGELWMLAVSNDGGPAGPTATAVSGLKNNMGIGGPQVRSASILVPYPGNNQREYSTSE